MTTKNTTNNSTSLMMGKKLAKLDLKAPSKIEMNYSHITSENYDYLINNEVDFFSIDIWTWADDTDDCFEFSPEEALAILDACNRAITLKKIDVMSDMYNDMILLGNKCCKIVNTNNTMKLLFIKNNKVVYQINSVEKIQKTMDWLKEVLKIGGYLLGIESSEEMKLNFKTNYDGITECWIDGELKGKAQLNPKDKKEERIGKLISFLRTLGFDKETENRIIDSIFVENAEKIKIEEIKVLREQNDFLIKQRTALIESNDKIRNKLCDLRSEIQNIVLDAQHIRNETLFNFKYK